MKLFRSLTEIDELENPVNLTIGMFDGLHKGHQHLLSHLKKPKGSSVVLTFINHPLSLLRPDVFAGDLLTPDQKIKEFEHFGIDATILLPFSQDIAEMSYQMFLTQIHRALPFHHLYIGENDAFGKNREGTKEAVERFAPSLGFCAHYIPKLTCEDEIISSTWVRKALKSGDINKAAKLLGKEPQFMIIQKGMVKPGAYKAQILYDGCQTFEEETIQVTDEGFNLNKPGLITLKSN